MEHGQNEGPIRKVYIRSEPHSLHHLSVVACTLHVNCGRVISDVALPTPVIDTLCVFDKLTIGRGQEDIEGDPEVCRNYLHRIQAKDDMLHRGRSGSRFKTDILIADTAGAAESALSLVNPHLVSLTIAPTHHPVDSDPILVAPLPDLRTNDLQYVWAFAAQLRMLSVGNRCDLWQNLETLQLHTGLYDLRQALKHIRTICRIPSLRNLSMPRSGFVYPYTTVHSITSKLTRLTRLDGSFSNLLYLTEPNSDDDLYHLRSYKRYACKGDRCILGLGAARAPLEFIGAVGCGYSPEGENECGYDENGQALPKLLLRSKRSASCRTALNCIRSCRWYWNTGMMFSWSVNHYVTSFYNLTSQHREILVRLSTDKLAHFNPLKNVSPWYYSSVNYRLMALSLSEFELDHHGARAFLFYTLAYIRNLIMKEIGIDGYLLTAIYFCEPNSLQGYSETFVSEAVVDVLLEVARHRAFPSTLYHIHTYLSVLISFTDECPAACRMLLSDRFANKFLNIVIRCIDAGYKQDETHLGTSRELVYCVLANICEVPGLCLHFADGDRILEQLVTDCETGNDPAKQKYAARILCWILIETDWKGHRDFSRSRIMEVLTGLIPDLPEGPYTAYRSVRVYDRLLSSKIEPVIMYALRELRGISHQVDRKYSRRYCFMIYLEGLLPKIKEIRDRADSTCLNRMWATEIEQTVAEATKDYQAHGCRA